MDKICEDLKTSYNMNLLDNCTPIQQAVFLDEAEKNKNENKGKITLMKLIYNHFRAEKPIISKITGPKTLTVHWSRTYKKLIYVFGESHGRAEPCESECKRGEVFNPESMRCISEKSQKAKKLKSKGVILESYLPIDKYFEKLFLTTDVFIDYFVEVPAYEGIEWYIEDYYADSYLKDVMAQSAACVQVATRVKEKCALIRAHYIDVRRTTRQSLGTRNFIESFNSWRLQEMTNTEMKKKLKEPQFASIIDVMTRSRVDVFDYFMDEYRNSPYNSKEVQRSYIKNDIDNFAVKIIGDAIRRHYFPLNILAKELKSNPTKTLVKNFARELIFPNARIVDPYTLARIFKRFDVDKIHTLERVRDQPVEPRNIIIYAGDNHSNNYRSFFDKLGFVRIAESSETIDEGLSRCLNMENIPQPLFSQNPPL